MSAPDLTLPPQAIESERALLGGLFIDNTAWERIGDMVSEGDFYRAEHRLIYRAIEKLLESGTPADALTASEWLNDHGKLYQAGGQSYLGSLVANTAGAANIRRYAEIVRNKALLRGLVSLANEVVEACMQPTGAEPAEIAGRMQQRIDDLVEPLHGGPVALRDAVGRAVAFVDALKAKGGGMAGIATGFVDLDRITGGLSAGDLIILAGRPSMGKTALGLNIAEYTAKHGGPVAFFSLEMSQRQLALRILSGRSRVSMHRLHMEYVQDEHWLRIEGAMTEVRDLPILLDDTSSVTCGHIRARCRRIKRERGLSLVVVDYLQLMRGDGDNRTQEVGSISRGLKVIAKDLDIPVIALSQLSRRVEERSNKRPVLSDLRDSGEIEQDADLIAFIYRDEVYDRDSEAKGTAELLIRKQRNGPLGDIRLHFREELMRFESYAGPEIHAGPKPRVRSGAFEYKPVREA